MGAEEDNRVCAACAAPVPSDAKFCPSCGTALGAGEPRPQEPGGEYRQITVMFCDLVGSTALSNILDPEDLRDALRVYQDICARAIESNNGMIARYLGDGIIAYFGYPMAAENAAVHGTEASLSIVREIAQRGDALKEQFGCRLAARVALHTGRVLISEMGAGKTRERHSLTGVVPNLAARLEQFAPENGVVVSRETRALILGVFQLETLGHQEMKGFDVPIEVFHVKGHRSTTAVLPSREAPLEGRETELNLLLDHWRRASDGETSRVNVIAEPGTGKSALAAAFLTRAGIAREQVIEFSGALSDRNIPFSGFRQALRRWTALIERRDGLSARDQMARWFGVDELEGASAAGTLFRLLNGDVEHGPEGRAEILAASEDLMQRMPRPLLMVVEDAHWFDPSSTEMLGRLTDSMTGQMTLVLTRNAPDDDDPLGSGTEIALDRLGLEACKRLMRDVAGAPVEPAIARRIADVAGGLPLYVEEFTKALIETGKLSKERGVYRSVDLDTDIDTPASLVDLITVRLDSLGEAKRLAQVCAVLGRSFSRTALLAVSDASQDEVEESVIRLTDAGILQREWSGQLSFRHALFQTAAYESLLRNARQGWHARYLDWLEANPVRLSSISPATLGFHLEACGRGRDAVTRYLEAGQAATRASAHFEAAAHFRRCRDLIAQLSDDDLGTLALQVQVLLGGALLGARGPGAPETREAYDSAVALARAQPESDWHFPAYWGWWRVSDSFATMATRADRLLEISESMEGLEFKLQAQHCVWANAFQMGRLDTSISTAESGLKLYDYGVFEETATLYGGHDCKVCAHGEIALARWLKGGGDSVLPEIETAIAHAEWLDHVGSLTHALDIAVMLHHYRRDPGAVQTVAQRLSRIANDNDLEDYRAKAEIFTGWVVTETGDPRAGLVRLDAGFSRLRQIGTPEDFPVYQCMRAAVLCRLGEPEAALDGLTDGRAVISEQGVNYWGAEIARHEAEVEMTRDRPDADRVRSCLVEADDIARLQSALALELRIAMTRLAWARQSGDDEAAAIEAIRSVRARFAAAVTGRDLVDADAVLTLRCLQ